eukprot:Tamp_05358.p1 GENE.Tamp_05358~~Tamp_05358.p1  ORF type:complete len:367 (+),score=58.42 Tamp_05358:1143-2243(+)
MSGVSQSVSTAINHHTLSEVKQEMAVIRRMMDGKGGSQSAQIAQAQTTQVASPAGTAAAERQEPQSQGTEQKVEKAPAGLPNARIFRKLNASAAPSAATASTAAPTNNSHASSSSVPAANPSPPASAAPLVASAPLAASSVDSGAHKVEESMPGQEISASSSPPAAGSTLHQSREALVGRADEAGDGATPLPPVLKQHLEAAGVKVSTPLPGLESRQAPAAADGSLPLVPGAAAGATPEASCIEANEHANAPEAESSGSLTDTHSGATCQKKQAASQSTLQTPEGHVRGAPQEQAPYSASFKEVMGMVREGKVPPDVATIDDTPVSNASQPAPLPPDSRKPRAKPLDIHCSALSICCAGIAESCLL